MAEEEKKISILNLSKVGRRYDLKDGVQILPNQAASVGQKEADFLLSKLPNGRARFPDLMDASKVNPAVAKVQDALLAENAKLSKENADLRAQLDAASESKKANGGKK